MKYEVNKAFTLMEILIVVAILGILAAIALPTFQSHTQQAKESATKDNLRILRNAIELYAAQHNGVPPGYPNGDTTATPNYITFASQLTKSTNINCQVADTGTPGYPFGPYISAIPLNPFNNQTTILMIADGEPFPAEPTGEYGWVYQPQTKTIKLDRPGTDKNGVSYYDY